MPAPRINLVFRVRFENGRIIWRGYDHKRFDVLKAKFEGKEAELILRAPQKRTTDPQRRYYFGVIVAMVCEAAGYGPEYKDAMHEYLKGLFLKDNSGPLPLTRSTQKLTTVEREEYHDHCRRWAAETFGLYIPMPNEVDLGDITV